MERLCHVNLRDSKRRLKSELRQTEERSPRKRRAMMTCRGSLELVEAIDARSRQLPATPPSFESSRRRRDECCCSSSRRPVRRPCRLGGGWVHTLQHVGPSVMITQSRPLPPTGQPVSTLPPVRQCDRHWFPPNRERVQKLPIRADSLSWPSWPWARQTSRLSGDVCHAGELPVMASS